MFAEELKQKWVDISRLLLRYERDGCQFLCHIVTGDESWVHYFEPENKRQ
jgi:hypothetical protein